MTSERGESRRAHGRRDHYEWCRAVVAALPDELFDFLNADADRSQSTVTTGSRSPEEKDGSTPIATNDDGQKVKADEPPPNLDPDAITIEDVDAREVDAGRGGSGGAGAASLDPAGPMDHDRTDRQRREIGRRGQWAAVQAERKRVESFGGDPSAVMWRSEHNPFAPYDTESLDEDGQRVYIEVKSTASAQRIRS